MTWALHLEIVLKKNVWFHFSVTNAQMLTFTWTQEKKQGEENFAEHFYTTAVRSRSDYQDC